MFITPIRHTPLKNMNELLDFSYDTRGHAINMPCVYFREDDDFFFSNEIGQVYVTPYRKEIGTILREAGYKEKVFNIAHCQDISSIKKSTKYLWLKDMADKENWYATFEEAFEESKRKEISSVDIPEDLLVTYVPMETIVSRDQKVYPLASLWLDGNSKNNICTYININNYYLLICDEYSRTYIVHFGYENKIAYRNNFSNFVNSLIAAGYKHTANPELYAKGFF